MQAPYDARFKILAEEYPDLLLRLLGIVSSGMKPQPVSILRELQLDSVQVDHVYRVDAEPAAFLVHFEAISWWRTERVPTLALYRFLLKHQYGLPVNSYIVLMAEKSAPRLLPDRLVYEEDDGFRIETPYRILRLWELDPAVAFEPGCEPLLPWVPLLKGGEPEFERTCTALERLIDKPGLAPYPIDVMVSNLATLAALRYDKDTIAHFVERLQRKIMISTDLFIETWLYKDGVAAGRAEGAALGELHAKHLTLQKLLHKKFPAIGPLSEVEQIQSSEALDELLLATLDWKSEEDVHAALQNALQLN